MDVGEYAGLDAVGLAGLIAQGEVSAAEVAAIAASAVKASNDVLNFRVGPPLPPRPPEPGPLSGVPILIKDIGAAMAGVPQELGSRLAAGMIPSADSTLVLRYRRAGLVALGRTTTPEFGSAFTTEPVTTGRTLNPWDLSRSTGGSSGGAAAAVAAGAVPIAHAGDSGGSIRIPAHCCGVFGLKPTRGRNPVGPAAGEVNSGLTAAHVITRTVRDSALVLDATAGMDAGARYGCPPPSMPFAQAIAGDPAPLRLALVTESPLAGQVAPEIMAAARDTAARCAALGHHVEEAALDFDAEMFIDMIRVIWSANLHHAARALSIALTRPVDATTLEPATLAIVEDGAWQSADTLLWGLDMMNRFSRLVAAFFDRYDMLICPTLSVTAPPLGLFAGDAPGMEVKAYLARLLAFAPFTMQFNVTGQPAASLPLHLSAGGLPIGTQIVARFGEEAGLLALSAQLERAFPWAGRLPPHGLRRAGMC
ncbi:amidase [Niveispirillum sp.]|uniref:amidase n=1 Tax=Niveispirillum sp. TaxID=1917217 RepID=UPI001B4FD608|nr:amidase [Niveispirillum sp.]MBP7337172.1 amidase [Niveispirillum sp.]